MGAFGYRDHGPEVGRWTSKDPIGFEGGELSLYTYIFQNPILLTDSFGVGSYEDRWGWCGAGGADKLLIDNPFGFDFSECCQDHDECFEDFSSCSPTLQECNNEFRRCMNEDVCGKEHGWRRNACKSAANAGANVVDLVGGNFFGDTRTRGGGNMG
ncbi:RHS repeat-associated core domain-containing protein [Megalodesulfovibrio paquesii]